MESSKSEPALGTDKKARSSMARAGGAAKRASTVVKLSKGGKKKSMIKKGVAASSNRLASGQSSELRDVGGNTEKSLSALEGLPWLGARAGTRPPRAEAGAYTIGQSTASNRLLL